MNTDEFSRLIIYESKAISFRPIDQIARFMRNGFVQIYRWYKSGQFWTDKDHGMFVQNRSYSSSNQDGHRLSRSNLIIHDLRLKWHWKSVFRITFVNAIQPESEMIGFAWSFSQKVSKIVLILEK